MGRSGTGCPQAPAATLSPMQWSGNNPPTGLSVAMRQEKDQDRLNRRVVGAVADDPLYQVVTVDGEQWICPYTGLLVPTNGDWKKAAQRSLFDRQPWKAWRGGKPRPLFQVLVQKWTLHLEATRDPRLLQFTADGRWQHPEGGEPVLLAKARSTTDPTCLSEVAQALAAR